MSPKPPVGPLRPDGTPVLTAPANTGVVGTATIYNWLIPQELDPNKRTIWYDIRGSAPTLEQLPAPYTLGTKGVTLPDGQVAVETSAYALVDGKPSPVLKMPDGQYVPLAQLKKQPSDHMVTPSSLMQTIAQMSVADPKAFMAIQTYLSSGVWGTVHVNGTFDKETESALGQAMLQWSKLTHGAEVPVDFEQYLQEAGTRALSLGNGSGSSQAPFQANLTDPVQIRQDAQSAAQAALGRGLSPQELKAFVNQFHQQQIQSQQAAYNGQGNVTPPDLSSDAMAFVQQNNPKEFKQNQRSNFLDMLANMLAGSSVRPESQPVASVGS